MLTEISEAEATGEIARIFDDVRRLWGVPYVSAIHRHLATRPGVLEWAWEAVGPAFRDARAQEAGWTAADDLPMAPLDPISRDALAVWGVDATGLATVRAVAEGFVRVAPVNMMFAGLVKALLEGKTAGGAPRGSSAPWSPPAALPAPPPMVALDNAPDAKWASEGADKHAPDAKWASEGASKHAPDAKWASEGASKKALHSVLTQFASDSGGKPFVPGLYRMLAHWPGLVAHLAIVLRPRLAEPATNAAFDTIRARIDAAVPGVLAGLPAAPARRPMPAAAERVHFFTVGRTYRKTSPELIVLGRLIADALPRS